MRRFWVDFENAPHIPVLLPIVRNLENRGLTPLMTARDFSFTVELAEREGLDVVLIGTGSKRSGFGSKALQVLRRVLALVRTVWPVRKNILFSLAHASRSQLIAAWLLGITSVSLEDYEFSNQMHNRLASFLLIPEAIPFNAFPAIRGRKIHYPGTKEHIYLGGRKLPGEVPGFLSGREERVMVLFRPEGRTAHYRSQHSHMLQMEILRYLGSHDRACILVYPRDAIQRNQIAEILEAANASYLFPPIVDGPDLVASVDVVVGGGGTMTREAATIGVPSYSFFSGEWGAVDEYLVAAGRLNRIEAVDDVPSIDLRKRESGITRVGTDSLEFVTGLLASLGDSRGEEALLKGASEAEEPG
jgi:hypothetical protein